MYHQLRPPPLYDGRPSLAVWFSCQFLNWGRGYLTAREPSSGRPVDIIMPKRTRNAVLISEQPAYPSSVIACWRLAVDEGDLSNSLCDLSLEVCSTLARRFHYR